jgi:hypothetical protein
VESFITVAMVATGEASTMVKFSRENCSSRKAINGFLSQPIA